MPIRPGTYSLRDIQPAEVEKSYSDWGKLFGTKKPAFNLSDKGNEHQLKAILHGIVSNEHPDDEINAFVQNFPETAPLVSQAVRQRDILKQNVQDGQPNIPGAVNSAIMSGELPYAKELAAFGAKPGSDRWEGPVLFDTNGNTYRATKQGTIEKIKVEGGGTIAPPIYPFTTIDPVTGQPMQNVISKPAAARGAGAGVGTLGPSAPLKPIPEDAVSKITSGLNAIALMKDVVPVLSKISGRFGGNIERAKVWLGTSEPDAEAAKSAIEQFDFLAQAFQKGAASEPDIKRAMDIRPEFGIPEARNRKRAENFTNLFTAILKSEISNYKGKGYDVPSDWKLLADDIGINIDEIRPYSSGKQNPYLTIARSVAKKNLSSETEKQETPTKPSSSLKDMSNEDLFRKAFGK